MKKTFQKYVWLFEWIAAAFIIAVGAVVGFVDGVVLGATGIALVLIAMLRIVPLYRTLNDKLMKWINAVEIIVNIAIGGILIYVAIDAWNNNKVLELGNLFSYLLGAILYVRGIVFFIGTSLRGESTDIPKFISNICFISLGVWFTSRPYDEKTMGYFVLGIAILCALYVIFDGCKNYNHYRHEYAAEIELKKIQKKAKNEVKDKKNKTKTDNVEEPVSDINPVEEPAKDENVLNDPLTDSVEVDEKIKEENNSQLNA